jgi:hypothetical protein
MISAGDSFVKDKHQSSFCLPEKKPEDTRFLPSKITGMEVLYRQAYPPKKLSLEKGVEKWLKHHLEPGF